MTNIRQGVLIDTLNQYLEWHNLPVRLSRGGVCNGLASIYVKYALEGRLAEFRSILKKIALLSTNSEIDSEINHFVAEIALSFIPGDFNKELMQHNSIGTLTVDGHTLKPAFTFGMVSKDTHWIETLKKIDLQEDEAMIVRSADHAVSISKLEGHYIVFDPNYDEGFKFFPDEKSVIEELHDYVFNYDLDSHLGMSVEVVRHPAMHEPPRAFPAVNELYDQYLTQNETAVTESSEINNLYQAIEIDQAYALELLYDRGLVDKSPYESAVLAIACNSTNVLRFLLDKIPDKEDLQQLLEVALFKGHQRSFDELLKNTRCKKQFDEHSSQIKYSLRCITLAAKGGNVELLKKMMHTYTSQGVPANLSDLGLAKCLLMTYYQDEGDTIQTAIKSGSFECVQQLVNHLIKANHKPNDTLWFTYLSAAIKKNHPHMVDLLIEAIKANTSAESQKEIFSAISISDSSVLRTDLSILRHLKSSGVRFSDVAEGMIAQKEHRPVGIQLSTGIMLVRFTDFINELLQKIKEGFEKVVGHYGFFKPSLNDVPEKHITNVDNSPPVTA